MFFADPHGNVPRNSLDITSPEAMCYGGGGKYVSITEEERLFYIALRKYNSNTIAFFENKTEPVSGKLAVIFYPKSGAICIMNSYEVSNKYEKLAIISTIMRSIYYDSEIYGDSPETMLIEWSAHNIMYHLSSHSGLVCMAIQRFGISNNPVESTRNVDLRESLSKEKAFAYNFFTLWGLVQW